MPPFCNFIFVIGAADSYEDRMRITENTVQSFKVAKIFKENTDKINSVTFSQSGEFLISSSNDDSIVIYDCVQGNPKRTLNSKKYGVDLIQLTHSNDTVSLALTRRKKLVKMILSVMVASFFLHDEVVVLLGSGSEGVDDLWYHSGRF